jgi:hypothetical protein
MIGSPNVALTRGRCCIALDSIRLTVPILFLVLTAGCAWDVYRTASVSSMPEPTNVVAVIKATPGVDRVDHRSLKAPVFVLTGPMRGLVHNRVESFAYSGDPNVRGGLSFSLDLDHKGRFLYFNITEGWAWPWGPGQRARAKAYATRQVMLQIEQQLETACGLTNLGDSVTEKSNGRIMK